MQDKIIKNFKKQFAKTAEEKRLIDEEVLTDEERIRVWEEIEERNKEDEENHDKEIGLDKKKKKKIKKEEEEYFKNLSIKINTFVSSPTHYNLAQLFKIVNEDIICTDTNKLIFYEFNQESCLWTQVSINRISFLISDFITPHLHNAKIEEIKNSPDPSQYQFINKKYAGLFLKIQNNDFTHKTAIQFASMVENKKFLDKINSNPWHINFKNGVYDFEKNLYRDRKKEDYVTFCLDYNYEDEDENIIDELKSDFLKIFNDDEKLLEANLRWKAYCLLGYKNLRRMLFTIGHKAENGKTTFSTVFKMCFPIYVLEVGNQTFNEGYEKKHKALADLITKPIRYIPLEEADTKLLDVGYIKKALDGKKLPLEIMYGTTIEVNCNFAIEFISNHDPRFKSDSGIKRSIWKQELNNSFFKSDKYDKIVEENGGIAPKGVYLANTEFLDRFKDDIYKINFFHLLRKYCVSFCRTKKIKNIPESWVQEAEELCEENDRMTQFIDNNFIKDKDGRIGKLDFTNMYNNYFKTKNTWESLINDVKRVNLNYDRMTRDQDGNKGIIKGIKLKDDKNDLATL